MRKMRALVQGVGINDKIYPYKEANKMVREYAIWKSMLERCSEDYWTKNNAYLNTLCSSNFKLYSFFYEWCNKQIGFNNRDEKGRFWQLDKDLLTKEHKVYSEDTCVFVPAKINALLISRKSVRGEYPIGVCFDKSASRLKSQVSLGEGTVKNLGLFPDVASAFGAYKYNKEMYIKQVAKGYKDRLDPRAYEALMNYEVNIDD